MKAIGILALSVAMLFGWGCAWAYARAARQDFPPSRLAYVDSITVPADARAGKPILVKVLGSLPDPSWEITALHHGILPGQVIWIRPWITKKSEEPVIQVIVPFEREVKLDGLAAGRWELQLFGFGDTKATATLLVKP